MNMYLQSTMDIRIRVNGEKKDYEKWDVVEIKDYDTDQYNFLMINWFVKLEEIQTTDASTKEIVAKKGKVAKKK